MAQPEDGYPTFLTVELPLWVVLSIQAAADGEHISISEFVSASMQTVLILRKIAERENAAYDAEQEAEWLADSDDEET